MWLMRLGSSLKPNQDESNTFKPIKHGDKSMGKSIAKSLELGWVVLI